MEAIIRKLDRVVRKHLEGETSGLEVLSDGRVAGHVISPKFDDVDYEERRSLLNRVLQQNLTVKERHKVGLLLTYTPMEWHITLS